MRVHLQFLEDLSDKHSPYDGDRRKGLNLEIVPRLEKSIRPRYLRIGGR